MHFEISRDAYLSTRILQRNFLDDNLQPSEYITLELDAVRVSFASSRMSRRCEIGGRGYLGDATFDSPCSKWSIIC
jgi:hypothetical protein